MKINPVVLIDTREQTPLVFANLLSERGTLDTGDYSLKGLEHLIALERKSLPDALACIGRERDRFKRELARLRGYRFRMLVIEASAADLERGNWRSELKPAHVLGSLAAWAAQYSLPIWLGGNHESTAGFVERYLYQCARAIQQDTQTAAEFVEMAGMESVG